MIPETLQLGFARKLPSILQTEAAECGLAALAMVSSYHGLRTDLPTLRARHSISSKGTTLADLMRIARDMNLLTRAVRVELEDLPRLATPCILHWGLNHFVVLKSATRSGIAIHDPACGRRTFDMRQASEHFTGVALELAPDVRFERRDERQRIRLIALAGSIRGLAPALGQIFAFAVALEALGLLGPILSQWIIDDALVSADRDMIVVLSAGSLLIGIVRSAILAARSWLMTYLATTMNLQWTNNVFGHLLQLPMPWFEKRHIGDVVSRFGSLETIQQGLTAGVVGAVIDGVMAVITLVMMYVYSAALANVVMLAVVCYALVRIARLESVRAASEELLQRSARQNTHFLESVRGAQAIKLFNREDERRRQYLNLVVERTNGNLRIQKQSLAFSAVNSMLTLAENVLVIFMGANFILAGAFSIGMLFAFIAYKDQFITRLFALVDQLAAFRLLGLQGERLADIVLSQPEGCGEGPACAVLEAPVSIEVRNASFRYADGEPWVLRNVSCIVAAGESVAIAGPSGCGKTTLLKIMLGQLRPQEGEVLIDGIPLDRLGLRRYRDHLGAVMQDDQLFSGSLIDNISFFDPAADRAQVEAAARMAGIHDEIDAMPMGYQTLIGDLGTGLSGGQKQRVVLARALYKSPRILFLDEATSHLDTVAEQALNREIRALAVTRVMVAHRPQTLQMADRIVHLPALQSGAAAQAAAERARAAAVPA